MDQSARSVQLLENGQMDELRKILSETLDEVIFFSTFIKYLVNGLRKEGKTEFQDILFYQVTDGDSFKLVSRNGEAHYGQTREGALGPISLIKKNKSPYICNDCSKDPLFASFDREANKSIIYPVIVGGEVLGIIYLRDVKSGIRAYDYGDISYIKAFTSEVMVSLKNMQMFLSVKSMNEQLLKKIGRWDGQNGKSSDVIKKHISLIDCSVEEKVVGKSELFLKTLDLIDRKSYTSGLILLQGPMGVGKEFFAKRISRQHRSGLIVLQLDKILEEVKQADIISSIIEELNEIKNSKVLMIKGISDIKGGQREGFVQIVRKLTTTGHFLPIILHFEGFELYQEMNKLNADIIELPELYKRKEDIVALARHFVDGKDEHKTLSDETLKIFEQYDWPENAKELKKYIDCSYLMSFSKVIDASHLPEVVKIQDRSIKDSLAGSEDEDLIAQGMNFSSFDDGQISEGDLTLASLEKRHIFLTLGKLKGNKTRAAKALGITVKTLYNKLHLYGLVVQ